MAPFFSFETLKNSQYANCNSSGITNSPKSYKHLQIRHILLFIFSIVSLSIAVAIWFKFAFYSSKCEVSDKSLGGIFVSSLPTSGSLLLQNYDVLEDGYRPQTELLPMEQDQNGRLLIHTWHEGNLFAGFELLISSALLTQHLKQTKLILWMDIPWDESSDAQKRNLVRKYRYTPYGFVEFRLLNATELALQSESCWKDRPEFLLKKPLIDFTSISYYSDIVRILLLEQYGGVWIDSDTTLLADFQIIHRKLRGHVVAGMNFRNGEEFIANNNLIYISEKKQRNILADISCEYRTKPRKIPRLDYTDKELKETNFLSEWGGYTMEAPLLLNGKEYHGPHHWYWNDGVLGLCSELKGLCNLYPLNMARTDGLWFGVGGLTEFCESAVNLYSNYVPSIEELYRSTRADCRNVTAYWEAQDVSALTWVTHDRKASCRTFGAGVAGTLKIFERLINLRLGKDPKIFPVQPLDFLYLDPWMLHTRYLPEAHFSHLAILIKSDIEHKEHRRILRAFAHNRRVPVSLQLDAFGGASFSIRILFVVEINDIRKDHGMDDKRMLRLANGHLIEEAAMFDDILIVPPEPKKETATKRRLKRIANKATSQLKLDERKTESKGDQSTLKFPNLRLYKKYGKYNLFEKNEFPLVKIPDREKYQKPYIEIEEIDQEVAYENWGERAFKGDGFISRSMELGLMKWSLIAESLYVMILNNDATYFDIRKIQKLIFDLMDESHNFSKIASKPTFVIGLTNHEYHESTRSEAMAGNFPWSTGHNTPIDRYIDEKNSFIVSSKTIQDDSHFSGLLVSRNVLPYLLSSDNPVKQASKYLVSNCNDLPYEDLPSTVEAEYVVPEQIYSYSVTAGLHTCADGRRYPLNSRISLNQLHFENDHLFLSRENSDHIRIIVPEAFNQISSSLSIAFAGGLLKLIPSETETYECVSHWRNTATVSGISYSNVYTVMTRLLTLSGIPENCPYLMETLELLAREYLIGKSV